MKYPIAGLFIFATCTIYVVKGNNDGNSNVALKSSDSNTSQILDDGVYNANEISGADIKGDESAATTKEDEGTAVAKSSSNDAAAAADSTTVSDDITTAITHNNPVTVTTTIATANSNDSETPIGFLHENRVICICKLKYDPVCGSNGVTYSNDCVLNCISNDQLINNHAPVHKLHRGECRSIPCNCPKIEQPLCGSNNETYSNDCYFTCENARRAQAGIPLITVAYRGACSSTACKCPTSVIPVCGTDGKTYRNICIMQCYSRLNQWKGSPAINLRSIGPCKVETCNCPLKKNLVCASDDNTYNNLCKLVCQNRRLNQLGLDPLTVQYPGECKKCICPLNIDPVCGSDGKSYSNLCMLECESEKRRRVGLPELNVRWRGPCNCGCTWEWSPVCSNNQVTWANHCLFTCENKRRAVTGLPQLTVLYDGECRECNCNFCPKKYKPVCGSDRQTYRNMCYLNCNSDCLVNCKLPPLRKIAESEC